jgi:beta-galactosidase/beta-glucuronidase
VREQWSSLDGTWQFAFDDDACVPRPDAVAWDREIAVPFAPETPASGIGDTGFHRVVWYRRAFDVPPPVSGERVVVRFGAVDYAATIWVNGERVAFHEGGYTPFSADITAYLAPDGRQQLVVRAEDDPHDIEKPRGKQDWELEPHQIWYPRTTGIWQTVWIERLAPNAIASVRWTPDLARWAVACEAVVDGPLADGLRLRVRLSAADRTLADDTYAVEAGEVARTIALPDPGTDSARSQLLWSPAHPALIDALIELTDASGAVTDSLRSYTAMRTVAVDSDAFLLNGRPLKLRMALDQGYWPESGLTAPDDDALRRDVELAKQMGFNGVRKHQKIEAPRYLYWADRLGLLVWEEMPSAYRFSRRAVVRLTREWTRAVQRDYSHPCIVAWVPLNESWGVPDLPSRPDQRHYAEALYALTRALDPTRPVIGNDGWEHVASDILGVHDYTSEPAELEHRYAERPLSSALRPAGRRLWIEGCERAAPLMLTEFGGISLSDDQARTWGYVRAADAGELALRYERMLAAVHRLPLAGFCYTQFADTYQETNGLLDAQRRPKFPLEEMRRITRGR